MKVAILYPWPTIRKRTGASIRVQLLIDYLKERCEAVSVFSVANERDFRVGNVQYIFFNCFPTHPFKEHIQRAGLHRAILERLSSQYWGAKLSQVIGKAFCEIPWLNLFYQFRFNADFKAVIRSVVKRSDVVFLEYPFWAKIVGSICNAERIPWILTAHDIISRTYAGSRALSRLLSRTELDALRLSSSLCCVAEQDHRILADYGIEARCISNPIDISKCKVDSTASSQWDFRVRHELESRRICLFVGSGHIPNYEAVETMKKIATKVPECTFLIVGACASPGRTNNVVRLGEIDEEELALAYGAANLVIIPLERGTGSSLKLLEAMAYGKPILTTTAGCRGYAFKSGVHGLVADRLDDYPEIVNAMLEDESRLREYSTEARRLSEKYDYRTVYDAYWDIIKESRLR